MLSNLLALFGLGGPENDARILLRDARAMIEMIHGQHGPDSLRKISGEAKYQIEEVRRRGLNDTQFYARGVEALPELNRAARARRDNIAWSGITLAIIYIKAEITGEYAVATRNTIDGFMEKWAPAEEIEPPETEPNSEC